MINDERAPAILRQDHHEKNIQEPLPRSFLGVKVVHWESCGGISYGQHWTSYWKCSYHSFHHLVLLLTCTSPTSRWILSRWTTCGEFPLVSSCMGVVAMEAELDFSSTSDVSWEREDLLAAFLDICRSSPQEWCAHGFTFILHRQKITGKVGRHG